MSETDPMVITADIKFQPTAGEDDIFRYTVAADFAETLVSIQVTDALRGEHATLPIQQLVASEDRNQTMLWFDVNIEEMVQRSKDSFVYMQVTEVHKRRKMAYPAQASILDKQSFQIIDSAVMLTPYKVLKQTLDIVLPKTSKLVGMTRHPNTKTTENKIQFGGTFID